MMMMTIQMAMTPIPNDTGHPPAGTAATTTTTSTRVRVQWQQQKGLLVVVAVVVVAVDFLVNIAMKI